MLRRAASWRGSRRWLPTLSSIAHGTDDRHQRDRRGPARPHRPRHDAGLPGRARDRPPEPPGALPARHPAAAAAARAPPPPARGDGARPRQRARSPSPSRRTSCRRWRPQLRASGVEAVAVCLLHAYAHPAHEARLRAALEGQVPFVSASHEINAEFREYERSSTTALNAAVMPIADRYLADLEVFSCPGGDARDPRPPPVERGDDVGGSRAAPAARDGGVGARRRRGGLAVPRPHPRPPERDRLRHGRDHDGRLPDRRWTRGEPAAAAPGRASGTAAFGGGRVDRRGRRVPRRGPRAAPCGSDRRARERAPGRPATGRVATSPHRHRRPRRGGDAPSATRSSAKRSAWTRRARRPRSRRSPRRSGSSCGRPRPPASSR